MKIVADDKIPFLKGVLEPFAEVVYLPGGDISREIVLDADALLTRTRTKCTSSFLRGTKLKFIGTATIGFDHIDTDYCQKNNIFWTNAPGCNSSSVQQYMISAMLKVAEKSHFALRGKTIGIVGAGNVGSKVEKFARLTGMKVLVNDPPRARSEGGNNFVDLPVIMKESDIITFHVPLNMAGKDKTWHLLDRAVSGTVKKGLWVFNTSRGEVTGTDVLKNIIKNGLAGGVVLDVWENEPFIDTFLMSEVFLATPHIAGYSADGKANGTSMVVNALCDYFSLPLKNWYPFIPPPPEPLIRIDTTGKKDEEIIREAVMHTYNVCKDDSDLRSDPSLFEKLRGDYGLRREFSAYTTELLPYSSDVAGVLNELGFSVKY